jgi:hypothetical protein
MKEFLDKLEAALKELVTLEVTTVVGNIPYPISNAPVPGARVIHSRIDLLQGDILVEMAPDFVNGDLKDVRVDHLEREKQAAAIIKANVELVERLFKFLQGAGRG